MAYSYHYICDNHTSEDFYLVTVQLRVNGREVGEPTNVYIHGRPRLWFADFVDKRDFTMLSSQRVSEEEYRMGLISQRSEW